MTAAKTILITGGTRGIGAEAALLLLRQGHRVAVTGRSSERLAAFLDQADNPDRLLGVIADAANWDDTRRAVDNTVERFGALDGAVANAGFAPAGSSPNAIEAGDPVLWAPMVLTNVLGPALLARAALPHLEATKGRFILIGSVAGVKNAPGNLYSATKWAVTGLAENLRMHATNRGVGVTLLSPGYTNTAFHQGRSVPPGAMTPADVAALISFALNQPPGIDLNTVTVRPLGQAI
jgi:NADP-dependent 3-hydroxy acid dehydrogenase YdfG